MEKITGSTGVGMKLQQQMKLTQQVLMTPQLQQAIKLLHLSRLELTQYLLQQIAENPFLEEPESFFEPEVYPRDRFGFEMESRFVDHGKEWDREENWIPAERTLSEHLLAQSSEIVLSKEEQRIAEILIGNIGDKGFLDIPLEEVAEEGPFEMEVVEGVLDTIQRFDPPGIAARTLQESLLIQLREKKWKTPLLEILIEEHLEALQKQHFSVLAKKMKVAESVIRSQMALLAELEPIPARRFGYSRIESILPDVRVVKIGYDWVVTLPEDGISTLRLHPYYEQLLHSNTEESNKAYLQEKWKAAVWLLRSLQQRQQTIFRVAEKIVERQVDFFENGIQKLKPMILKDIAEELALHESTVSRVTTHKYLQSPRGVFELRYFFTSGISATGGNISSLSVKNRIQTLIEKEDAVHPHSDQKLADLLAEEGVMLARRTVTKYREQLHISSSAQRKRYPASRNFVQSRNA